MNIRIVFDLFNNFFYRLIFIGFSAIFLAGIGGWILGYLTEKASGGSILPAFFVHGIGNFLLVMAEAFYII